MREAICVLGLISLLRSQSLGVAVRSSEGWKEMGVGDQALVIEVRGRPGCSGAVRLIFL